MENKRKASFYEITRKLSQELLLPPSFSIVLQVISSFQVLSVLLKPIFDMASGDKTIPFRIVDYLVSVAEVTTIFTPFTSKLKPVVILVVCTIYLLLVLVWSFSTFIQ